MSGKGMEEKGRANRENILPRRAVEGRRRPSGSRRRHGDGAPGPTHGGADLEADPMEETELQVQAHGGPVNRSHRRCHGVGAPGPSPCGSGGRRHRLTCSRA